MTEVWKRKRRKFTSFCTGARFGFPWGPSSSHLRRASRDRSFLSGLRARDHGYVWGDNKTSQNAL